MFFSKKSPHTTGCMIFHVVTAALLLLAMLASLVGVYKTHFLEDGLAFGASSASLALIAFAASTYFFMWQLKMCFTKCEVCSSR